MKPFLKSGSLPPIKTTMELPFPNFWHGYNPYEYLI